MAGDGGLSGLRFQVLPLAVQIDSASPELLTAAQFLVNRARQPQQPDARLAFEVVRTSAGYDVLADGLQLDRAPDANAAVQTIFGHLQGRVLSRFPAHVLIRGAVLTMGLRRILLCGETGCGLTSVAVAALYAGAAVEGDAFALLGADGVTPLPRPFVLHQGSDALLREVSLAGLPSAPSGTGVVWAFDPARAGFPWELERGRIGACVWVRPNHGGHSRLSTLGHTDAARLFTARCSPPPSTTTGQWLQKLIALLAGAGCFELQLGRLEDALRLLRTIGPA
ncbi:MAG: hypothetical protein ACRDL8_03260 [Solirubrobacteraceae bacterium]